MSAADQTTSGGGWFSKIVVVVLLVVAIGLYLRIVTVDGERRYSEPAPQASVRVLEGDEAVSDGAVPKLIELPPEQMDIVKKVFAPELMQ